MRKILLVEDEESQGYLLSEYLNLKEFEVTWIQDPLLVIPYLRKTGVQLAILDVMMPGRDGFELAAEIKAEFPDLPFLFLTSRTLKVDALKAFSIGAVDYLRKPIDEEELLYRIRAIISRMEIKKPAPSRKCIPIGIFELDFSRQVLVHNGEESALTLKENQLLKYLALNKNEICTYRSILISLWGENDYFKKKSLNVFITRLRKHLKKDPNLSIVNVHGKGFILKEEG